MLQPLRERDFALLWIGLSVSLLGDGIYFVALAFQAYALENDPSALALVGVAFSVGLVAAMPVAGLTSDRRARRGVLMGSDAARAAIIGTVGALSLGGALELWSLAALVALFGVAEAFHYPAFQPLVAELLPPEQLVRANSLEWFVRPLAMRVAGPVLGGLAVAALSPGGAFLLDAGTFVLSLGCVAAMRTRTVPSPTGASMAGELRDGLRYVRSQTWLWGTLLAASLALLAFYGPVEVLVPYIVRNDLDAGAAASGCSSARSGSAGWPARCG